MKFLLNFPGTPRTEQEYILTEVQKAFDSGKRFVIVQAPTGIGKSHVGAALAMSTNNPPPDERLSNWHPQQASRYTYEDFPVAGAFVLTTTKQLQDQYYSLFPDSSPLKGKDNYICDLDPTSDAGMAPCVYNSGQMDKCSRSCQCDYIMAYRNAILNNFSELNYNMYFSLPPAFKRKELLICDEASELEDQIISYYSLDLIYKLLDYLTVPYETLRKDDTESGYLWVCDLMRNAKSVVFPTRKNMNIAEIKRIKALKQLQEKLSLLMEHWHSSEFVVELKKGGLTISPLKANKLARIMFANADKIVFMSATIINPVIMAESLGINSNEYTFVDVDSNFDPKKSPIYISPAKFDMRYGKIDSELPKMVKEVLELCKIHKNDKGIIHTNSFKITEAFREAVDGDPRFLIREEGVSNEVILNEHFTSKKPTVLISPSLAFGTSLDDEHGRFQIITKLPYLPMTDKRIKIAAERSFEWYQMKMWIKLVQMCGRCTRSKEDHSVTYIFDSSFISALKRYRTKLPKWFVKRLV